MKFVALAGLAALSLSTPVLAGEADTPNIGAVPYKIGRIEVVAVHDNHYTMPNDGKVFGLTSGPDAVATILKAHNAPADTITVQFGGLMVKDGKRLILIDTGAGPGMKGGLIDSLKQVGVTPDQITDVLITHAHFDHVGGLMTADGKSAFPNATIRMTTKEWGYFQTRDELKTAVAVLTPQVKTFEPGARISDHVRAVAIEGHTPGHSGYEVHSRHKKLLDIGDASHSSILSLAHPEWTMGFDDDKDTSAKSRMALLKSLSKSGEVIFAPHFPFPGLGRIKAVGEGTYEWEAVKTKP